MASGQPKKSNRRLSVEKVVAIVVCLFLLWPLAECGLPLLLPNPMDYSRAHAVSPGGEWTATVYERVYASTFSDAEFAVKLSGGFSKDIFIIDADNHDAPEIKWRGPKELLIYIVRKKIPMPVKDAISLQLQDYEGIHISYEVK